MIRVHASTHFYEFNGDYSNLRVPSPDDFSAKLQVITDDNKLIAEFNTWDCWQILDDEDDDVELDDFFGTQEDVKQPGEPIKDKEPCPCKKTETETFNGGTGNSWSYIGWTTCPCIRLNPIKG